MHHWGFFDTFLSCGRSRFRNSPACVFILPCMLVRLNHFQNSSVPVKRVISELNIVQYPQWLSSPCYCPFVLVKIIALLSMHGNCLLFCPWFFIESVFSPSAMVLIFPSLRIVRNSVGNILLLGSESYRYTRCWEFCGWSFSIGLNRLESSLNWFGSITRERESQWEPLLSLMILFVCVLSSINLSFLPLVFNMAISGFVRGFGALIMIFFSFTLFFNSFAGKII